MPGSIVTWAIYLLVFAAILLAGFVLYRKGAGSALKEWWERLKRDLAADNARFAKVNAEINREKHPGVEVGLVPNVALDNAVETMTRNGYTLDSRTENTATFARNQGANASLGCCLMFFFIIPGLLYLLLANKTVRVTVAAYPRDGGGARLVIGGDDGQGAHNLKRLV